MARQVVLFLLDASASMIHKPFPTGSNRCAKNRLSYAQEAVEEMIYHLILQCSNTHENEAGVILFNPIASADESDGSLSGGDSSSSPLTHPVRLLQPTVSFLQSLHTLFGQRSLHSSSSRMDMTLDSYAEIDGNYVDGIILAADIFKQISSHITNKRIKPRFRIVLLTDAIEKLSLDAERLDEAVQTLCTLSCSILTVGFDFLHTQVKEFVASNSLGDDSHSSPMEDINDDNIDSSSNLLLHNSIQMENELFIISLTQVIGGIVFPVKSSRHLQRAIKGIQASGAYQRRGSSMKKMELILSPNLSVSTRTTILSYKNNLPSLKREVILLDSETGDEMIDGAGEYMTGRLKTTSHYWDTDHPHVQVPEPKLVSVVQFGSKDLVPVGVFDLQGLRMRTRSAMTIIGYISSRLISLGLLLGPTRVIVGNTKRSRSVITALSRSMYDMNLNAICTFSPKDDSDPQMGVIVPYLERPYIEPDRLLFLRFPFSDDIQNLHTISPLYPLQSLEPLTQDEENASDNLIDALMLPRNESSEVECNKHFPLNPTNRLFHHFVREKATHANYSTPCSHHTFGNFMFLRNKSSSQISIHEEKFIESIDQTKLTVNQDEHNETIPEVLFEEDDESSNISTPTPILQKAHFPLENFRALFPLRKVAVKQKIYWSDCY